MREGLSSTEAKQRLKIYGENKIEKRKKVSPFKLFASQFTSPIIILLIVAAILSFSVNFIKHAEYFDSVLILIIVFASGIAGFVQDYKAEQAVEALQRLATPKAKVIRDGKEQEISATEIIPGDLIVVEGGDVVPADAEILEGNLKTDESPLTGESKEVKKKKGDKIYSSCGVYTGRAIAKVHATGMHTRIGKIAAKMQEIDEGKTPFQQHIEKFTKKIVAFTALIIIITFAVAFNKFTLMEASLIAISLAVAAVPEDLPAVVTIALSLGARQMTKRKALVRRLAITESVGSVDVICTDKTGTLTEGKMKVRNFWFLRESEKARNLANKVCFYCNDAKTILEKGKEKWIGDETDIALKQYASFIKSEGKRIDEVPFTSEREMMTVVHDFSGEKLVLSKGALEVILAKSSKILIGEKIVKLDKKTKETILKKNEELSSRGFRILSMAYKDYKKPLEKNLIFIGLVLLSDPPRPEVREAIEECYSAGIRVIMITGDNPLTAKAIAEEVGMHSEGVLTGSDLDKMDEEELNTALNKGINIFARTTPFHKLRILEALQKEGHTVAMTGDGVNDALAIKKADVGISMGIKGTEVAKEASDIVLLDDNFASIRNAVKEGRRIFDNIRKFVDYLLTCNLAEVIVVLLATLFLPFISLYPVQILWINLITDGLPALALSVDPARPDVMKRKPKKRGEGIINKKLIALIGGIGIEKAAVLIITFLLILPFGLEKARTALFTGFILYEIVRIVVIRYEEKLCSFRDWLKNKFLVYSLIISILLQLVLLYTPLASYFKVVPLSLYEWGVLLSLTFAGFVAGITIAWIIDKMIKEEY